MDFTSLLAWSQGDFQKLCNSMLLDQVRRQHVSALLVAALQLECSPVLLEASRKWQSGTLHMLFYQRRCRSFVPF